MKAMKETNRAKEHARNKIKKTIKAGIKNE
jgi:hypothetical protein